MRSGEATIRISLPLILVFDQRGGLLKLWITAIRVAPSLIFAAANALASWIVV